MIISVETCDRVVLGSTALSRLPGIHCLESTVIVIDDLIDRADSGAVTYPFDCRNVAVEMLQTSLLM
jgi:hypothetical protein